MSELVIVAALDVDPEAIDTLLPAFQEMIAATRLETGCLQYDLHQDNSDPSKFLFFERWTTRDIWQQHMVSPHVKAFQAAAEGKITSAKLSEMTLI